MKVEQQHSPSKVALSGKGAQCIGRVFILSVCWSNWVCSGSIAMATDGKHLPIEHSSHNANSSMARPTAISHGWFIRERGILVRGTDNQASNSNSSSFTDFTFNFTLSAQRYHTVWPVEVSSCNPSTSKVISNASRAHSCHCAHSCPFFPVDPFGSIKVMLIYWK